MKKRFSNEQVIRIFHETGSLDEPVKDLCKRHNISEQTFYRWRDTFGAWMWPTPAGSRCWNQRTRGSSV